MAGIDNTRDTKAEHHVDGKLNIVERGVVSASGDRTVSLGAEEEALGEQERSLLAAISSKKTLEGGALLESTVGVVDPTVLEHVAVSRHVSVVLGHAHLSVVKSRLENGWLVHVVPDTVHVVGSLEDTGVEEVLPVVASAVVQEVNPDGLAAAALSLEGLEGIGASDEEVADVVLVDKLSLLGETLLVHEVVIGGVDVGVGSDDETTARSVDLVVHVHDVVLRESLVVELTVLVVLSVLAIEPEDIDGEAELGEVVVPLNHLVGRVVLPLGEVVAERVHRGHWGVASQLREFLLELLGGALGTEKVELESVALGDEGGVGLVSVVGVVEEDVGLSGVHPGDGGVGDVRVTHDVGDGAEKRLVASALRVLILVVKVVGVSDTSLGKTEVIGTLWKTEHVSGVDSEVHTDGVSLLEGGGVSVMLSGGFVVSNRGVVMSSRSVVVSSSGIVVGSSLMGDLVGIFCGLVVNGSVLHAVVEQVVVVVDNDGLVAVDVLDDSEGIELDLVGDSVLAGDKNAVIEHLDEVLEVLLDLDLVPVDADASVADGEALLLLAGLDLDLHDTVLEHGQVEVEVRVAGLNTVEVLVVVKSESAMDSILVDDKAVGLDEVSGRDVVAVVGVLLVNPVVLVVGEKLGEAVAVVLLGAGLIESLVELVVRVALIRVLLLVSIVSGVVHGLGVVVVVLDLVVDGVVVRLTVLVVSGAVLVVVVTVLLLVQVALLVNGVLMLGHVLVSALMVERLFVVGLKNGLGGHLVVGEGVKSCLSLKAEEASGNDFGGGVHLPKNQRLIVQVTKIIIIIYKSHILPN